MAVTYTWKITDLSTTSVENYPDVVTSACWEASATDDTNTVSLIGITPFALPENTFISYEDLTEEQLIGWVKANLSELRLNEIKGSLISSLHQLGYQAKPLPWNLPKPAKKAFKTKSSI
jgi:hypothetical protein